MAEVRLVEYTIVESPVRRTARINGAYLKLYKYLNPNFHPDLFTET